MRYARLLNGQWALNGLLRELNGACGGLNPAPVMSVSDYEWDSNQITVAFTTA
jgi:hypothetical protein